MPVKGVAEAIAAMTLSKQHIARLKQEILAFSCHHSDLQAQHLKCKQSANANAGASASSAAADAAARGKKYAKKPKDVTQLVQYIAPDDLANTIITGNTESVMKCLHTKQT